MMVLSVKPTQQSGKARQRPQRLDIFDVPQSNETGEAEIPNREHTLRDDFTLPNSRPYMSLEKARSQQQNGNELAVCGRLEDALCAFSAALRYDVDRIYLYAECASQIFLIQGDFYRAIQLGMRSIASRFDYAEGHWTLARALFNFGELDESITHLQVALTLTEDSTKRHEISEELKEFEGVKKRVESLKQEMKCTLINDRIYGSMYFYESGLRVNHEDDEAYELIKHRKRPLCC